MRPENVIATAATLTTANITAVVNAISVVNAFSVVSYPTPMMVREPDRDDSQEQTCHGRTQPIGQSNGVLHPVADFLGKEQDPHHDHADKAAHHAQDHEGRHLPVKRETLHREIELGQIAEMDAA